MKLVSATLTVMLLFSSACHEQRVQGLSSPLARQVANLHAFARLYGVVRWFHPSDSASAIDWDRFAIEGARRVLDAPDERVLTHVLSELFAPVAPTVQIAVRGAQFRRDIELQPNSITDLAIVAWEHRGFGDSLYTDIYDSKRRNRDKVVTAPGFPFAALSQAVDAGPFQGSRIRLRGKARTSGHARAQLWLRVERDDVNTFFDNMDERPVTSPTWQSVETIGTIDSSATRIVFGVLSFSPGATWYDDIELSVQGVDGSWTPLAIENQSFEESDPLHGWRPGIGRRLTPNEGWQATVDHSRPASGTSSLKLEPATRVLREELFEEGPRPGDAAIIDLGGGLHARVPLALYSRDGRTLRDDPAEARRSQSAPISVAPSNFDAVSGIADVIVVWNVLNHFWPYWDVVKVDWTTQLDASLVDALDDRNIDDHVSTMERLSAAAPDGHASTTCLSPHPRAMPPFSVDLIEGQITVIKSTDRAVSRGDIIVSIDGRPAIDQLHIDEAQISGSPQWKLVQASDRFGVGPSDLPLALRIRRGGLELTVSVPRIKTKILESPSRPSIQRLEDGVYIIDLSRASIEELNAQIINLASAPGVVFDLRGYPKSNHEILSHLLSQPDRSNGWMAVPHIIRPDHVATSISNWEMHGWNMPVLHPHISGRVAFLTGPGAISYAESVMGFVEFYHLGEIVGAATAGTNGNIAEILVPSGCRTRFTGMRVTKHDGSRQHLLGIQPTMPVFRTLAGVTDGRDEVLEKALSYVRTGSK